MKNNIDKKKNKRKIKIHDIIIAVVLVIAIATMVFFTSTRETGNQEIVLMEIYKSAGPNTSTASPNHYYIYDNTNVVGIRNSNFDNSSGQASNSITKKEISQELIDNFKVSLEEYISKNFSINTGFYINERYTIEYNGKTLIVPNPDVAQTLQLDENNYSFYYIVENFISTINN